MSKIPVGVLGATGLVGQTYIKLLEDHPLFELAFISASSRSDHLAYREAIPEKKRGEFLEQTLDLRLSPLGDLAKAALRCRILFSALPHEQAIVFEEKYAERGLAVFSSASTFRNVQDIPMIIPEINSGHLALIKVQREKRGWKEGSLVVKPNCTLQSFLLPLFPLHRHFQLRKIMVTTFQSTSGGGLSLELKDNILPYIQGEEEKSEGEPLRILGSFEKDRIAPLQGLAISSHCNRAPISEGHFACVSVSFEKAPQKGEILSLWQEFKGEPQKLGLPFAPKKPIHYLEDLDRPQPQLDKDIERGMSVAIGRLRPCPLFDVRFTALSHNLIRGAAGGGILTAELALAKGFING